MTPELMRSLIEATARTIEQRAEELTALDSAIGDGDHGFNMARGFNELLTQKDTIAALPLGAALQKAGMALVMKVGGASGPLYGSLLMEMGKAAPPDGRTPTLEELRQMLQAGIEGVKRRGKSERGEKTMLDVLCPVVDALGTAIERGEDDTAATRVLAAAAWGLHKTSYMLATKGRASFLGERSKGHIDPGACSSALLVGAVISVLDGKADK